MSASADAFSPENTVGGADSGDVVDSDYQSRTGQSHIPVTKDDAPIEDPIDAATADSDETLGIAHPSIIRSNHHDLPASYSCRLVETCC